MRNIKLSVKLVGGFMGIALLTCLVGMVGTISIYSIDKSATELYEKNAVSLVHTGKLKEDFQKMRNIFRDGMMNKFLFNRDVTEQFAEVKALDQTMQESVRALEKTIVGEDLIQTLAEIKAAFNEYYPSRDRLSGLVEEGKQEEAVSLLQGDVAVYGKKLGDVIVRIDQMVVAQAKAKSENNTAKANRATVIM